MLENDLILDDARENVPEANLMDHVFRGDDLQRKYEYEKHQKALKNARLIMLVVAILGVVADLILLSTISMGVDVLTWVFVIVYFVALIGLYFLSFRYPLGAFTAFLVLFLGMWLLAFAGDSSQAYRGMLLRIAAVVLLVRGAISAGKVVQLRRELVGIYLRDREAEFEELP